MPSSAANSLAASSVPLVSDMAARDRRHFAVVGAAIRVGAVAQRTLASSQLEEWKRQSRQLANSNLQRQQQLSMAHQPASRQRLGAPA